MKFSSPWRTVTSTRSKTSPTAYVGGRWRRATIEISVPLVDSGWQPQAGAAIGPIWACSGDGQQTTQRVYWSNKATAITADVPSEGAVDTPAVGPLGGGERKGVNRQA